MNCLALARSKLSIFVKISALIFLAKPNIVGLTLVAALTGMYVGNRGVIPQFDLVMWTFILLGLATAGACMLNNIYDQDIDQLMPRTRNRALVHSSVSPVVTLLVAIGFSTLPVILMAFMVNIISSLLTGGAVFIYVVVYSIWAKRRTAWANQLGGIAGALPPLIGCVAVNGSVDVIALVLFAIMVLWQQPHALSLALKYREDYARAGIPVVPIAKGIRATKWRIVIYCGCLFPVAALPYAFEIAGPAYLVVSLCLGMVFFTMAVRFLLSSRDYNMKLFFFSIVYLVVLFGTMVWDIQRVPIMV